MKKLLFHGIVVLVSLSGLPFNPYMTYERYVHKERFGDNDGKLSSGAC